MRAFSFDGRAGIGEFWRIQVGVTVLTFLTSGAFAHRAPAVAAVFWAILALAGTAVSVRRLHDRDMSGWYLLVSVVPILGWFWWLFALGVSSGTRGMNRYGMPES